MTSTSTCTSVASFTREGFNNPNALALQEIGDPNALDDLVGHLDGDWHQKVSRKDDGREIRGGMTHPTGHH